MRIGIDVQTTLGQKTGFGFYVKNLTENLKKIDKKNEYILIKPDSEKDLSTPQRFIWDQFKVPSIAKKNKVNVLHQPCFSAPIFHSKMKVIVTIHDLIAIRFGQDIPFFSRQYFGKWMPYSYRFADKIICDSEHTKKDVVKILQFPASEIDVVPLAVSDDFRIIKDQEKILEIKKKYHTGNKYFLHVGTLNPRKNLLFLIKTFSRIVKDFPEYSLVITGKKGWYYEGLFKAVEELKLADRVIFSGYVSDEDSPTLYNGATLFLFPSLYEGFGLPPLEAMSCGIPVISSNTSSLPEVIGKGGITLNPTDELSWVREIKSLLKDKNRYEKLTTRAIDQSKQFSWVKTAQKTLEIYQKLYEKR